MNAERWHYGITRALEDRPHLRWAYDNDAAVHAQIHQLNVVMLAVERATEDLDGYQQRLVEDRLLADPALLPTDDALLQMAYALEQRRQAALAAAPVVSIVEPCPECRATKCGNCTGETLNADDELVPCPCPHDGRGVLVMPRGMFSEAEALGAPVATPEEVSAGTNDDRPITPLQLPDPVAMVAPQVACYAHPGVHSQRNDCMLPVARP